KTEGAEFSIRCIPEFEFFFDIPIAAYIVLLCVLRTVSLILCGWIILLISAKFNNVSATLLVSMAVFALPVILYLAGAEIQYEGEVEMTGCIQVLETVGYSTAGDMNFYPDGNCVSQIPAALYCTEDGNPERGVIYMAAESWGSYGYLNEIILGNMNDYDIDFDGLKPGNKNVRVKVTIKNPSILSKWGYMWCSGEPTSVTVIDN
ncbi:MAG: hypothetical protein K2J77_11380, partial [Oscillospiraceae bacterium]|nr:hypothetical protein [Oscillospiraceae bacterium]